MKRFLSKIAVGILLFTSSGAWSQIVEFRLETTDLAGIPIDNAAVGDDFLFNVFTTHVSGFSDPNDPSSAGVFSAFLDITYDGSLASTTGPIDHAQRFSTVTRGILSDGFVDNAGGLATEADPGTVPAPTGPVEHQVFSLPFSADATGTLNFVGASSGDNINFPVLVFGINATIDPADVSFGSTSINIVPEPTGFLVATLGAVCLVLGNRRKRRSVRRY